MLAPSFIPGPTTHEDATAPEQPKRAAIYARVSTARDQDPTMQLEVLREFAERSGYEVVREYVDHGVSGTKASRPALNQLMDAARKRELDAVLVYRFDRFARSVRHLVTALDEFEALAVDFVSYCENLDTSTPFGKAMFAIVAALAQLDRDVIVERSVEGQRRARERGVKIGRPRTRVDHEAVRRLRAEGLSLRAIGKRLGVSKHVVTRALQG